MKNITVNTLLLGGKTVFKRTQWAALVARYNSENKINWRFGEDDRVDRLYNLICRDMIRFSHISIVVIRSAVLFYQTSLHYVSYARNELNLF